MRLAYVGALIGASLVIGCGGDDDDGSNNADRFDGDDADVAAVIDDFAQAGRDGDGEQVCDEIFTEALKGNIERESEQSCASEVQENIPEGEYELTVDSVAVKGQAATVSVTDENDNKSVLQMVKTGDEWRVARVQAPL
jgi:hypothetical protein